MNGVDFFGRCLSCGEKIVSSCGCDCHWNRTWTEFTPGVIVVGKCGLCGGQVQIPETYAGSVSSTPQCISCGAFAKPKSDFPILEMNPPYPNLIYIKNEPK